MATRADSGSNSAADKSKDDQTLDTQSESGPPVSGSDAAQVTSEFLRLNCRLLN